MIHIFTTGGTIEGIDYFEDNGIKASSGCPLKYSVCGYS